MTVFVFDLDFTIWNAGDTFCSETRPPYLWNKGNLLDQSGRWIRLYQDVPEILKMLKNEKKIIAIASRTLEPTWARNLLQLFKIDKYIDVDEIYPGSKTTHIRKILNKLKCGHDQIVFFDDEERNILEVSTLGVKSVLVTNGISRSLVTKYL